MIKANNQRFLNIKNFNRFLSDHVDAMLKSVHQQDAKSYPRSEIDVSMSIYGISLCITK